MALGPEPIATLSRLLDEALALPASEREAWLAALPFSLRVPRDGHVVMPDSGGFPSPTAPPVPRVHGYDFADNPRTQQFPAALTRSVSFEGLPVVFAEDIEVRSGGIPFDTAGHFAADSLQLRIVRIDTRDGSRQLVAADPVLFNFPSKLQFLPPVAGRASLVGASDQEHRLAAINAAITMDLFQPPWISTQVLLLGDTGRDRPATRRGSPSSPPGRGVPFGQGNCGRWRRARR